MRDPYEVLGVSRSASPDEIKSAYRRLARRFHPDVNPDDPSAEEKFKEVGKAYSILSDPARRQRFDQFGTADDQPQDPFFGGQGGGFGDLFEMFFGGMGGQTGGRRRQGRDGEDVRVDVKLNLGEVLTGVQREVEVERYAQCKSCNGLGTADGKAPDVCGTCKGQGAVMTVRNTFIGQVRTSTACPTCQGEGTVIRDKCAACSGVGLQPERTRVPLNIPAGVEDGATMHVPGQGSDGTGMGRPGDLYAVLSVERDPRFERRGQTLISTLTLTFAQASLGDQVEIDGLEGPVALTIPAGTQPGTQQTVRGQGLPPLYGGRRGDLVVQMTVKVPEKVSEAEVKLIRELAELRGEKLPTGEAKGGLFGNLFGKKK